eukprot:11087329-Alexandrium_andersonii.AAC.1
MPPFVFATCVPNRSTDRGHSDKREPRSCTTAESAPSTLSIPAQSTIGVGWLAPLRWQRLHTAPCGKAGNATRGRSCLLYTSPSPRD